MSEVEPRLSVLVVDDDKNVLSVLELLLDGKGYRVASAACGEDALKLLAERPFDAVLLDVHLPDTNGQEVLAHIRRSPTLRHLPVILVTGSRDAEYDLIDVFDYLPKPVDFDRLFDDLEFIAALKRVQGDQGPRDAAALLPDGLSLAEIEALQAILMRRAGLNIPLRRRHELGRAVESRMRALLKQDLGAYLELVDSPAGEGELKKLLLMLTVGETYFFRNTNHFTALTSYVLPRVKERLVAEGRRAVTLLSAGCSTGEEAYSLAIALHEVFPANGGWEARVLGLDINNRSLNLGRRGAYRASSFRAVDQRLRDRYFDPEGDSWSVKPYLRDLVEFRYFNLRKLAEEAPPPWLRMVDVVFCRNVLIYFDQDTIARSIQRFSEMIPPGGFLFLGHAESFLQNSPVFETLYEAEVFFYRRRSTAAPSAYSPTWSSSSSSPTDPSPLASAQASPNLASPSASAGPSPAPSFRPPRPTPPPARDAAAAPPPAPDVDLEFEFRRGVELLDQEDFASAGRAFERLARLAPGFTKALVGTAYIQANRGEDRAAMELVDRALSSDPSISEAYFLRALLHERHNRAEAAFDDYQRAVLWDPAFIMARLNLGFAAERLGTVDAARRAFAEAWDLIRGRTAHRPDQKLSGGMSLEALEALARGKAG